MTQETRSGHPGRISPLEWGLAFLSLLVASLAYTTDSYGDIAVLAGVCLVIGVFLTILAGIGAVRTGIPGRFLLLVCVAGYFWIDAFALAQRTPSFAVESGLSSQLGSQSSLPGLQQAFVYVSLFQLMLLIGYSIRPRVAVATSWVAARIDVQEHRAWLIRLVLVACAWIPVVLAFGGVSEAINALSASRSQLLNSRDISYVQYLTFFGLFGAALLIAEGLVLKTSNRLVAIGFAFVTAFPYVLAGARHLWLYAALPAIVLMLAQACHFATPRVNLRRVAQLGMLGLAVLLVMQLQFVLRGQGWGKIGQVDIGDLTQPAVAGQFTALLYAEHLVPEKHDYFLEFPEPYFAIHWIPRRLWPDKPIPKSWTYYNSSYTRGGTFNVTPSIIGQYHINFGPLGVAFIGLWLGFLAYLADRLLLAIDLKQQKVIAVVIGMGYAFIVSSFRFYSPVYFTYLAFGIVAMLWLTRRQKAPNPVVETGLQSHAFTPH